MANGKKETRGRKGLYEELVKPFLLQVEAWARDGATDEIIYKKLGIGKDAFYRYKKEKKEFSDALKKGKEIVDIEVENALLKKALGFKETVKKAVKVKRVEYDNGRRELEKEEVVMVNEEVYVPPDTASIVFWLKNRRPDKWRDKQNVEVVVNELENLPPEEAKEHIQGMIKDLPPEILKGLTGDE